MPNKPAHYAAIDLGAESGRVVLGSVSDSKLELTELHRFPNGPVRTIDELHWDTLRLWSEMKTGVGKAAQQAGGLKGVGIDTWGVDFGLLGKGDTLLGNPFHYRDARTDGILDKAFGIVPREEIFNHTGIQFMQFNSIFQLLAMRLGGSPLLDIAESFLMMPDLFNFWFTGRKCNEFSNATTTQAYDPRAGKWATDLISKLGIPTKIFGEIVPAGTVLGPMRADVRDEIRCGDVPVIAPATHDTGSAVAAIPASPDKPWVFLSSGTWSLMGMEVDKPIINEQSLKYNYTNEGGVGGTFRFLKNIMGLWLVQECRRTWERAGKAYSYAELADMAAAAKPFVAIIDPDDSSFLAPGDMPARIQAYCKKTGQPTLAEPGEMVRACLESLALVYRWTLERIEECTGRRAEVIHIVGGGSQNRHLSQWAADATGRTVVTGPVEATAAGNVVVQAMATGVLPDIHAARDLIRRSFEVTVYRPGDPAPWDKAYARFQELRA
ncbi:MAG TPA: rhamnulokinase family protein [Phycisphaerae bacterium]|jgi:rhamnulokinase|nr:rhamnulokinase [Phycisphaerae bacterium]HOB74659.1 rhamnulokinase family protein [Phycisphaerae bacterium]HOJ53628.1 rhamnulokinase family protein [Phycisphaerae bacterium]HOL26353.1 rhamnulokinase family protein [Phycisphaerae bacterium]HPP21138.1 rhamnulokinase family protein [Phycisphaerae bacterium]